MKLSKNLEVKCDEITNNICSFKLYGKELLDTDNPSPSEFYVNGLPLQLRKYADPYGGDFYDPNSTMKGERFTEHLSGWGLVLSRNMGERISDFTKEVYSPYNCFGINYIIRREKAHQTCISPGPGGPVIEAPLFVDTFSLLNLNWKFWGEDTRMIFGSSHSAGPADTAAHIGYENDTPEVCKKYLTNVRRRLYPGVMVFHGGIFYNVKTEEWVAITCRNSHVGYILNTNNAGKGVSYDFTLHAEFKLNDWLRMPEIRIFYGNNKEEMNRFMADYVSHYYQEPPEWTFKTLWKEGLTWNNAPTWKEQGDKWIKEYEDGQFSGIKYSLVTNRPVDSGTNPFGYEPDPNHGTKQEFKEMCLRLKEKGIPMLIWMSHSGLVPGAPDVKDDWFIRGIDGRISASWGSENDGMFTINPGHPEYIEYTKKWIKFYIKECGAKGIFFDCLGWAFSPDYTKRDFMRYPGDTNLQSIKFMNEMYDYIKELDPEAIMLGEGTSLEGPCNIFALHSNPVKAIDGLGPRDFFLNINKYSKKRFVIDQAGFLNPGSGLCETIPRKMGEPFKEHNRFLTKLLREVGGRDTFKYAGDLLSVYENLLFVAFYDKKAPEIDVKLPAEYDNVKTITEKFTGKVYNRNNDSVFEKVYPGIYEM